MAALMNNGDRAYLRAWYRRDPVIQKKVDLMADLLSKFCGPNQGKYFWERAITSLKTQPEVSPASNQPGSSVKVDLQKTIGGDLIDAGGQAVSFQTLKGKKCLLLYFSASWCPHCRQFMPQFVGFYQNSKYRDKFEVIFVSSDRGEPEMLSYLREMPWKAVRFNSAAESFLKANYSRGSGVPTLTLIDSDGRLLGFRKGFARDYDAGVDKMLDILNQKLSADN
jgi:thiol-disulfide isomerase/thioredoxin